MVPGTLSASKPLAQAALTPALPYFYSCEVPLVHHQLDALGLSSAPSLVANTLLRALPCLRIHPHARWIAKIAPGGHLLGSDCDSFVVRPWSYPTLEDGLDALRAAASQGQPTLVGGPTYALPYSPDYENAAWLEKLTTPATGQTPGLHVLSVHALDETAVTVYDAVPHRFYGVLPRTTFEQFWAGFPAIPALARLDLSRCAPFSTLKVHPEPTRGSWPLWAKFARVASSLAQAFLAGAQLKRAGQTYHFGHAALSTLQAHLLRSQGPHRTAFEKCVFDVRFAGYLRQALLEGLGSAWSVEDAPKATASMALCQESQALNHAWETLYKQLKAPSPLEGAALERQMTDLREREYAFYQRLDAHTQVPYPAPHLAGACR